MPKRRKKPQLADPNQITAAIYSLTTRGKHARSHIAQELRQIITAAKSQLADYQKGLENHRRHKKRNPNWPSSIRAASWFAANRRDRIDEPQNAAARQEAPQQEEHEWKSLEEYESWIRQSVSAPAPMPAVPVPTAAQIAADQARRLDIEVGRERKEKWAMEEDDDWQPAQPQPPACPAQRVQPRAQQPEPAYEPTHEVSGYDLIWARQEAQEREREARQQQSQPVVPAAPKPVAQRPPQKGEPGYVTWLYTEIARRKAAGTWNPD